MLDTQIIDFHIKFKLFSCLSNNGTNKNEKLFSWSHLKLLY